MITKQHVALYVLVAMTKGKENMVIREEIPYLVLPDAIRAYIGQRQIGHFEVSPNGTDCSWMKYPMPDVLKELSKETAKDVLEFYLADGYPKCVIGEETNVDLFKEKNWAHPYYHALLCHMEQDVVLDDVLRTIMIDPEHRFEDRFIVRHNGQEIDGPTLRKQVALFEELGFIKLAGAVFYRTGTLLTKEWFDENVWTALEEAYPHDLAINTYKYMIISDEVNDRIKRHEFSLTEDEKNSVFMAKNLDAVLDKLYARAYNKTVESLV